MSPVSLTVDREVISGGSKTSVYSMRRFIGKQGHKIKNRSKFGSIFNLSGLLRGFILRIASDCRPACVSSAGVFLRAHGLFVR